MCVKIVNDKGIWRELGAVKDIQGKTYITAEDNHGDNILNNGELNFIHVII